MVNFNLYIIEEKIQIPANALRTERIAILAAIDRVCNFNSEKKVMRNTLLKSVSFINSKCKSVETTYKWVVKRFPNMYFLLKKKPIVY